MITEKEFKELKDSYLKTGNAAKELDNFKVSNAIILAAGGISTTQATMYSPPKGLFKVDGVPIIERQIRQLLEVGISEIYVVVGYKKEMYFYLEEKYGVHLIGNPNLERNNIYSLFLAKDFLKNSYVCACDYYYEENPFSLYEYKPYHATTFLNDAKKKFVVSTDEGGKIVRIRAGAERGECIHGLAYFDYSLSKKFSKLMCEEIEKYRIASLFWEEFFALHLDEINMYSKHFEYNIVKEVDDIDDLKSLNVLFVNSVSSLIVENICRELNCIENEITNVDILEAGHSNITFKVTVKDNNFVYRYPGISGKNIVNRKKEVFANQLANELGIDNTLVYIDEGGHKISRYVSNASGLKQNCKKELDYLAKQVKKLHEHEISNTEKQYLEFNPLLEADRLMELACRNKDNLFDIFSDIREEANRLGQLIANDNFEMGVCHCNLNSNNCLITNESFDLIDWEFSGYCDVAFDFPFIGDYEFKIEDLDSFLESYYSRKPTAFERRHWMAYRVIQYWYYTCWAIYKESLNEDCGNLLLIFYNNCKKAITVARPLFQ